MLEILASGGVVGAVLLALIGLVKWFLGSNQQKMLAVIEQNTKQSAATEAASKRQTEAIDNLADKVIEQTIAITSLVAYLKGRDARS